MSDVDSKEEIVSSKSRLVALILGIFLGNLGIHNFYLGQTGRGILKISLCIVGFFWFSYGSANAILDIMARSFSYYSLIILGFFMMSAGAVWALVEWIVIACGAAKDSKGLPVKNW